MNVWLLLTAGLLFFLLLVLAGFLFCARYSEADWGSTWWVKPLDGLNRIFSRHVHKLQHNEIHLPETGAALLVCNHVSGLEPLLMIAACRRPIRFLIAREEYERFGLHWLFKGIGAIPVERSGRPENALREALRALETGEVVALFPHGGIHLDSEPPGKLKGGVAKLAQLSGAPIFPLRVTGIRGEGYTVRAVFMPSRAHLQAFAPLDCTASSVDECLQKIAPLIEGRESAV
jgi:1-acyl-sn-glycerol-3-phosphate acyltransferase